METLEWAWERDKLKRHNFFSCIGLMISGLSRAHQALGDSAYLERATRAAQFVQSQLYKTDSGRLIRNAYRDNSTG